MDQTYEEINLEELPLKERIVYVNRVSKVVAGGKRFSFSALVVVGDEHGHVGYGLGKAKEVPEAVRKGIEKAKKNLIKVPIVGGGTIPHQVKRKFCSSIVILRPAAPGTGVIAGGVVRAVLELAGVKNVLTKSIRSNNPHNLVKATLEALKSLRTVELTAHKRGKKVEEIVGLK